MQHGQANTHCSVQLVLQINTNVTELSLENHYIINEA